MSNILVMVLAFGILCGIALLFHAILAVNMGESMALSAAFAILLLYISSLFGTFTYGMYGIYIAGAAGVILWIIIQMKRRRCDLPSLVSPTVVLLFITFAGCLILYHNDFIQHIDEFHQWAAAVKYMLTKDALPTGNDFITGGGQYAFATSIFHLFFQKLSGYSEQNMYVSASLLAWIGFLLPFSSDGWKNWKKVFAYAAIIYISIFSLYLYGFKNLYVDIPTVAWAGGLAGWWINREKKKPNVLILGSGMILLHFMKASVGILLAVFVLLFVLIQTFVIEKRDICKGNGIRKLTLITGIMCGLVILGSVVLVGITLSIQPYSPPEVSETFEEGQTADISGEPQQWMVAGVKLPDSISARIIICEVTKEKVYKTFAAFLETATGTELSSNSSLHLPFLAFLLLILMLFEIGGMLSASRSKCRVYILYSVFVALSYSAVLFFSYIYMFSYVDSVYFRGGRRYFAICGIFLFVIALRLLFQEEEDGKENARRLVLIGLMVFFALGLNEKFIQNATALDKENITGYEKITSARSQAEKVSSIIGEEDRVFFIYQYTGSSLSGSELVNASVLYYLDNQVSNHLTEPWKFTEKGSYVRLEENALTLGYLPYLLAQGGYTYLWIYKTNDYLSEYLPTVLECDKVSNASLYKVEYQDGLCVGLELVQKLK